MTVALDDGKVLDALGVTNQEQVVYEFLLAHPGAGMTEIVDATSVRRGEISSAIKALEEKGLLTRSAGKKSRFVLAPPQVALEALIVARQDQLDKARIAAARIEERFRSSNPRTDPLDLIEVITSKEAVGQRCSHLQSAAKKEMLGLTRLPLISLSNQSQFPAMDRGVEVRIVYDRHLFEHPGYFENVWEFVKAGEQVRIGSELPVKLTIFDRRVGFITFGSSEVEGAIVVHSSHLLDALVVLWEMIWERSVPLDDAVSAASPPDALSEQEEQILGLLLAGAKNQVIARQMRIGVSTLERAMKELMHTLGAETRFQAGFRYAELRAAMKATTPG